MAAVVTTVMRQAREDEAGLLSEIAIRAKGYWGYDQAFLDACRAELTFTPAEIAPRRIVVVESSQQVLGFYSLDGEAPEGELGNLWVVPEAIGTGLGRRLWEAACDRRCSGPRLHVDQDRRRTPGRRLLSRDGRRPRRRGAVRLHPRTSRPGDAVRPERVSSLSVNHQEPVLIRS